MRGVLALVACAAAACGGKSGLWVADGGFDGPRPECARERDCDDGVDCTLDRCRAGQCVHEPDDSRCEDGLFCNGPARCTATGCALAPVRCDDGVSCTVDACDEELRACVTTPDASLCPISHRCDLERGCVARALIHDSSFLFEVDLPSGDLRRIAPTDVALTDVALRADGRLFGVNRSGLFAIDETDGTARWIASPEDALVALDFGPDGALYGAGVRTVVRLDSGSGAAARVGGFPPGWSASGDLAFIGDRLLVTATRTPFSTTEPDSLFEVPRDGSAATLVGSIGVACVWGLAPFGETLYGLTCTGQLVSIDPVSGAGRVLRAGLGAQIGGAAAR